MASGPNCPLFGSGQLSPTVRGPNCPGLNLPGTEYWTIQSYIYLPFAVLRIVRIEAWAGGILGTIRQSTVCLSLTTYHPPLHPLLFAFRKRCWQMILSRPHPMPHRFFEIFSKHKTSGFKALGSPGHPSNDPSIFCSAVCLSLTTITPPPSSSVYVSCDNWTKMQASLTIIIIISTISIPSSSSGKYWFWHRKYAVHCTVGMDFRLHLY